ncbi:GNAT family N-acetyltransferase [Kitasatospora sp. NPDC088391]|uniref:GNAT family N-acetyltransferase n=1 Tax=Kitasatospora sp. NPDC088391 TaxID=3364074 RepID=UPI0038307811
MTNDLLRRARRLWTGLAEAPAAFPPRGAATVLVSPDSGLCPAGWVGLITLDGAVLATAPDERRAALVRAALHPDPGAAADPQRLRAALPIRCLLGTATLAYLAPDALTAPAPRLPRFPPGVPTLRARRLPADHPALRQPAAPDAAPRTYRLPLDRATPQQPAVQGPTATGAPTTPRVRRLPPGHPALRQLADRVPSEERDEAGLDEITSPVFAVTEGSTVLAACGYRAWPFATAQFSVLTTPAHRGRGLAGTVAAAAARHALAAGLLPQWRARPAASRRVAQRIGFRELGTQISLEVP